MIGFSRKFIIGFSGLIWVYLLLRALINEPLHDEIATYFFYIYQGDYYGSNMVVDANNHLINSFIGHLIYPLAKDHFFWYRLPSLLCALLYFYATYHLCKNYARKTVQVFTYIALNSIPFVMEYFAYTRGYGISLGFFAYALLHFSNYIRQQKQKSLFLCYLFLVLTITANLTFLQTSMMIATVAVLIAFQNKIALGPELKKHLRLTILFIVVLVPFIIYAFALKNAGALYYGGLDGMWENTGKSLVGYIFFDDQWFSAALTLLIFIGIIGGAIVKLKNSNQLKAIDFHGFILVLLFGNLFAIWFLATFLKVNYPEDRTAFALILFAIFALSNFFDQCVGKLRHLVWLFLYFPLSFIAQLSLHTSVFSPDDRITTDFYKEVKQHIQPENSLMIYSIMRWPWPWHESHEKVKSSIYNSYNTNQTYADILVTKTNIVRNPEILKLYDTIAVNPGSKHIAFKRKKFMKREVFAEGEIVNGEVTGEYFTLFEKDSLKSSKNKPVLVSATGHLKTFAKMNKIQLVYALFDAKGELIDYSYYPFEYTYQGSIIDSDFSHHFIVDHFPKNAAKVKVYFWSRQNDHFKVDNAKCYLYNLKEN